MKLSDDLSKLRMGRLSGEEAAEKRMGRGWLRGFGGSSGQRSRFDRPSPLVKSISRPVSAEGRTSFHFKMAKVSKPGRNSAELPKAARPLGTASAHQEYVEREEAVARDAAGRPMVSASFGETGDERVRFWQAVEERERSDGRVQTRLIVEVPHELPPSAAYAMMTEWASSSLGRFGAPWSVAIHDPDRHGDNRNLHAHVNFHDRPVRRVGEDDWEFGDRKIAEMGSRDFPKWLREQFTEVANKYLEVVGADRRLDPRTYEAMGIEKVPEEHLGNAASALERQGIATDTGVNNAERHDAFVRSTILQFERLSLSAAVQRVSGDGPGRDDDGVAARLAEETGPRAAWLNAVVEATGDALAKFDQEHAVRRHGGRAALRAAWISQRLSEPGCGKEESARLSSELSDARDWLESGGISPARQTAILLPPEWQPRLDQAKKPERLLGREEQADLVARFAAWEGMLEREREVYAAEALRREEGILADRLTRFDGAVSPDEALRSGGIVAKDDWDREKGKARTEMEVIERRSGSMLSGLKGVVVDAFERLGGQGEEGYALLGRRAREQGIEQVLVELRTNPETFVVPRQEVPPSAWNRGGFGRVRGDDDDATKKSGASLDSGIEAERIASAFRQVFEIGERMEAARALVRRMELAETGRSMTRVTVVDQAELLARLEDVKRRREAQENRVIGTPELALVAERRGSLEVMLGDDGVPFDRGPRGRGM